MEAVRFEVQGRVQGVGYRFFVVRAAHDLQLRGWVRNRADTGVEVAVLGAPARLRQLERLLRAGPPAAQVAQVARSPWPLPPEQWPSVTGFEIVHDGKD